MTEHTKQRKQLRWLCRVLQHPARWKHVLYGAQRKADKTFWKRWKRMNWPSSTGVSPFKDAVHCCDSFATHWSHIASRHDRIVHARVTSQTLHCTTATTAQYRECRFDGHRQTKYTLTTAQHYQQPLKAIENVFEQNNFTTHFKTNILTPWSQFGTLFT